MSIQTKTYLQKKIGKEVTRYYASVWDKTIGKTVPGPLRDTRKEAVRDEARILGELDRGVKLTRANKGLSMRQAAEIWLESSKPLYAAGTWQGYKYYYHHYLDGIFGDRKVNTITPVNIQKFINLMSGKYKPQTVNRMLTVLSLIFQFSQSPLQAISANPCTGIKRIKIERTKKNIWSSDEIGEFLNHPAVQQSHYYPMFCCSLMLGMRPSEVCGLRESDFDRDRNVLALDTGYDKYRNVTDLKTTGSHRVVPLSDFLSKVIRKKSVWKKEQQLAGKIDKELDYLFVSTRGNPITPDTYSQGFRRLVNKHFPDRALPLYDCRHSFASNNLLVEGADYKLIADTLGNSVKVLLDNYVHVNQDQQKKTLNNYTDKILRVANGTQ